MAAVAQRVPFGEISGSRLRKLNSAKNCQNAITEKLLTASKDKPFTKQQIFTFNKPSNVNFNQQSIALNAPTKRRHEPSFFEDDSDPDTENIDPTLFSPKRTKTNDGISKPTGPHFVLASTGPVKAATTPSTVPVRKATPEPYKFPGGASTAPAGRTPPHKRSGLLNVRRINPPNFGSAKSSNYGMPFSLEAAIRGTSALVNKKPTLEKTKLPKGCYFEIYEDKPDDIAANMMDHATATLELSSEDELKARMIDERGKENIPPPDYVAPTVNGVQVDGTIGKASRSRRVWGANGMALDDTPRVALGSLPVENFYAEGLDATSVFHVPDDDELDSLADAETKSATSKAKGPSFVIAEDEAQNL